MDYLGDFDLSEVPVNEESRPLQSTEVPVENLLGIIDPDEIAQMDVNLSEEMTLLEEQVKLMQKQCKILSLRKQLEELSLQKTQLELPSMIEQEGSRPRGRETEREPRQSTEEDAQERASQQMQRLQATRVAQRQNGKSLIKLRDVSVLKMEDVSKVNSKIIIRRFLGMIESCAESDQDRIEAALFKMDEGISAIVGDEILKKNINSWTEFRNLLLSHYTVKIDTGKFIQELNSKYHYDISEEPRAFTNKLKVLYSSVEGTGLPNRDTTIKRILFKGLPPVLTETMSYLVNDNNIELETFIKELESQRNIYQQAQITEKKIRKIGQAEDVKRMDGERADTSNTEELLLKMSSTFAEQVNKGQENLIRALEKQKTPRTKYCGYCKTSGSHWSSSCPQGPPPRSCYDCWTVGHFKNDPTCPKKRE